MASSGDRWALGELRATIVHGCRSATATEPRTNGEHEQDDTGESGGRCGEHAEVERHRAQETRDEADSEGPVSRHAAALETRSGRYGDGNADECSTQCTHRPQAPYVWGRAAAISENCKIQGCHRRERSECGCESRHNGANAPPAVVSGTKAPGRDTEQKRTDEEPQWITDSVVTAQRKDVPHRKGNRSERRRGDRKEVASALEETSSSHRRLIFSTELLGVGALETFHMQIDERRPVGFTPPPRVPPEHPFDIALDRAHAVTALPLPSRSRCCAS